MKSIYKILLITDNHSLTGGGAEKYFFTLKSALEQHPNIEVHSLGFGEKNIVKGNTTIIKETSISLLRYGWRLVFNPFKYWQIRRALKRIAPDVIHLHNVKKYTISLLKAVQSYPVVQTVHDYTGICPTGWNLHKDLQPCATGLRATCKWQHGRDLNKLVYLGMYYAFLRMKKLLRQNVKKFIAPSPQLTRYLEQNNYAHAVWLPPFRIASKAVAAKNLGTPTFLYVGQLGKHKGVSAMLEEFAQACKINSELKLKIAGTGSCETALKNQVTALGLQQNIIFLGWCNPQEHYGQALALIFPSIGLEAFGLVITEAMRHSLPVIGTHRGPTAWLVEDGKTGLLYDPLQPGDLSGKILLLAQNHELAAQLGLSAAEKFEGMMGNAEIVKQHLEIYRELIESKTV
jgi:glycosyltransferase involved in cell wall biosynthesis